MAVHFRKISGVGRNSPVCSVKVSIQEVKRRLPAPLVATVVRLEAIWITLAICSPIPSGFYSIGNGEHASTFAVQRKLKLLQNQSHDAIFFMLRILNENGVMNLHEKLTGSCSPHVKHPTVKVISKARLRLVSKTFSKCCI